MQTDTSRQGKKLGLSLFVLPGSSYYKFAHQAKKLMFVQDKRSYILQLEEMYGFNSSDESSLPTSYRSSNFTPREYVAMMSPDDEQPNHEWFKHKLWHSQSMQFSALFS